ncbi:hypothetical protein BDB01DRAFT_297702 [Pilobolus umbonatus]|nr:hypothetical protein BDB01DRAFT_297702 [Pilobolus umbonatus]
MLLPHLIPFDQQVAGHDTIRMSINETVIIKPCNQRELEFYQNAPHYALHEFIPECYGTVRAATERELDMLECTELEEGKPIRIDNNVLHGFTQPCIMDLKIGSLLHDCDATDEKKKKMVLLSESTTSSTMGIRICGMKVYDSSKKRYQQYDKKLGKSCTRDTLIEAFLAFFFPSSPYAQQYTKYQVKSEETPVTGSSLLLVYEGDSTACHQTWQYLLNEDKKSMKSVDEELGPKLCDLRLIDFAHSDWNADRKNQDKDVLMGLDNTIQLLEMCMKRQTEERLGE